MKKLLFIFCTALFLTGCDKDPIPTLTLDYAIDQAMKTKYNLKIHTYVKGNPEYEETEKLNLVYCVCLYDTLNKLKPDYEYCEARFFKDDCDKTLRIQAERHETLHIEFSAVNSSVGLMQIYNGFDSLLCEINLPEKGDYETERDILIE
jgi:hypothetical protein